MGVPFKATVTAEFGNIAVPPPTGTAEIPVMDATLSSVVYGDGDTDDTPKGLPGYVYPQPKMPSTSLLLSGRNTVVTMLLPEAFPPIATISASNVFETSYAQ